MLKEEETDTSKRILNEDIKRGTWKYLQSRINYNETIRYLFFLSPKGLVRNLQLKLATETCFKLSEHKMNTRLYLKDSVSHFGGGGGDDNIYIYIYTHTLFYINTPHHLRGSFNLTLWNWHEAHRALCLGVESRPEAKVALVQLIETRLFKGLWIHYLAQLSGHMRCCPVDLPLWKVNCVFVYIGLE